MRQGAVKSQADGTGRETVGRRDAIGRIAAPSLSLPSFAADALPIYAGNDYVRKLAGLGATLIRAGIDLEWEPGTHVDGAVTRALTKWIESQWGGLRCINMSCRLVGSVFDAVGESVGELMDHVDSADLVDIFQSDAHVDPLQDHVALIFDGTGREEFLVGPAVEELNTLVPGLGWEALRSATAVTASYDVFDFAWMEFATEQTYWWGMDSEGAWAQETGEDISEYEGITRADLDAFAPVKRMRESRRLTRSDLRTAARHANAKVARIAILLLRLRELGEPVPAFSTSKMTELCDWRDPVDSPLLLAWHDFEGVYRMGDDYGRQLMDSGESLRPFIGLEGVQLGDEASLEGIAARWSKPVRQLRIADALLWELGGESAGSQAATPASVSDGDA